MHRWSLFYSMLRAFAAFAHFIYYKKITVINKSNIPAEGPVIIASNHQNAFMDPLAIICTSKRQSVFLSRADIFNNPLNAWFLKKFKVLPIYRIRDGVDSVKKNEEVFEECLNILSNGESLALFPEGTHSEKRSMLPLKKAVARIALKASGKVNTVQKVKIVPVGIYYSNITDFRAKLLVNYGESFSVDKYINDYHKNENLGYTKLTDEIAEKIKPLMINIQNTDHYDTYECIISMYRKKMAEKLTRGSRKERNEFTASKEIVNFLDKALVDQPESFAKIESLLSNYNSLLNKHSLNDKSVAEMGKGNFGFKVFKLTLFSPVLIVGVITNFIPVLVIKNILKGSVTDIMFKSSFRYVLGLILFPVYYLICGMLLAIFIDPWYIALIILFLITGIVSFDWYSSFRETIKLLRSLRIKRHNNNAISELTDLRTKIIDAVDDIYTSVKG